MTLISEGKFNSYLQMFHNKVSNSPYKVELIVNTSYPRDFESSFVGDSPRMEEMSYEFNALYEKEIPARTREKYGLPSEVNGTIYLSYKQLKAKGIERLNINTIKVRFEGRMHVINHVVYLDSMYGKYIGVQIFLTDELKGG